jgi:hypothetical protein
MIHSQFLRPLCKICALVAVTLVLPALAYAKNDKDKGENDDKGEQKGRGHIHTVPDGGPGIVVLTATFGAILLFSARRSSRAKAGSQL